ncbi:BON domain-containing protein [Azospirillum doebereinerae]|uniref:BON domain-containing protein n=1 Tax=Azospirillum doebereinerae TaxID=92933 RepID=A0A433JAA5_9PROT|nr:BON domain-containing protein [Azospirillum doebereinerae]MCG5243908.1 BON domain-containing protein [Azospirillum doebereinerae]RUQ72808.1 BON domain-containing protein [Azospirillum doebereinerae]
MTDLSLRQLILDELEFEPSINAANIGVAVNDGVATLTGHVATYAEKIAVETAVRRVKGVRGIAQEMEVRYPRSNRTSDEDIAKRALNLLSWDVLVPKDSVQVKVQDGLITLTGTVEWQFQKKAAGDAVHRLDSIKGIFNQIAVKPHASSADVKNRIEDALKRNAEVESEGIRVKVDGDKVILEGKVRAWYERQVAESAAWSAPGVNVVDDRLGVA